MDGETADPMVDIMDFLHLFAAMLQRWGNRDAIFFNMGHIARERKTFNIAPCIIFVEV